MIIWRVKYKGTDANLCLRKLDENVINLEHNAEIVNDNVYKLEVKKESESRLVEAEYVKQATVKLIVIQKLW